MVWVVRGIRADGSCELVGLVPTEKAAENLAWIAADRFPGGAMVEVAHRDNPVTVTTLYPPSTKIFDP